ncbi:hypothetical protein [Streptomyces sp. cg40]|uniref:hypothetical protein n=1 Tax=Streptomyces sp. cg40 TaxID=3419764 RepID=UPI003D03DD89
MELGDARDQGVEALGRVGGQIGGDVGGTDEELGLLEQLLRAASAASAIVAVRPSRIRVTAASISARRVRNFRLLRPSGMRIPSCREY